MRWFRLGIGCAAALGISLGCDVASALECPAPKGASPTLSSLDPEDRVRFISQVLTQTARAERRYALGWSLTYAGLSAGSWVMLPLSSASDPGQLVESAWNSGTSAFAALFVLYAPLVAARDVSRLSQQLDLLRHDRCAQLAEAERVLAKVADNQQSARNALAHISNVAFNVGLGLVLGYALHRPSGAAMSTGIGVVFGELMIATRPKSALQAHSAYKEGRLLAPSSTSSSPGELIGQITLVPTVQNQTYGLALLGRF